MIKTVIEEKQQQIFKICNIIIHSSLIFHKPPQDVGILYLN